MLERCENTAGKRESAKMVLVVKRARSALLKASRSERGRILAEEGSLGAGRDDRDAREQLRRWTARRPVLATT